MQISSTRRPFPAAVRPLTAFPAAPKELKPIDFAPTAGGLVLGGTTALLGHQLAKDYGHDVTRFLIDKGAPLVANGTISLECALKALPYVTDRAFQMKVGAVSFGVAGFALGAALLWPRDNTR